MQIHPTNKTIKRYSSHALTAVRLGLAMLLIQFATPTVRATIGSWNADALGNWSDSTKWSGGTIPGGAAGDTASLNFNITAARTVTIDTTSRTLGILNIGDPTTSFFAYTLAASGGANLTLDNSGSGAQINKTSASTAADNISTPITLNDNLAVTLTTQPLTISGIISESGGSRNITKSGTGALTLSATNTFTGNLTINNSGGSIVIGSVGQLNSGSYAGAISLGTSGTLSYNGGVGQAQTLSGNITGAGVLSMPGNASTLTVSGANNTYTGGTTIGGGTFASVIQATTAHALGTGTITLNGGASFAPRLELTGGISLPNNITLNGRSSTSGLNTVGIRNVSGNNTLSGILTVTVNGNQWTIQSDAGLLTLGTAGATALTSASGSRSPTFQGAGNGAVVGNMITSGANTVGAIIAGPGTWTFSGANTYSAATVLNAGQLNINNGGSSSANSAIGIGTFTIAGGSIDNTSASDVTLLPNNPQNWNGDFTYVGSAHNLNLGSGAVTMSASRQVTVSAGTLTVGGAISGASFGLTKAGAGTLALSGSNPFSGATTISAGTLQVGGSGDINSSTGITINGTGAKYVHTSTTASTETITQTLGTVDGSGTLATVNVDNNSLNAVQNGNGGMTVLTVGTLAFNGAATINAAQSGTAGTSAINVTGALTTTPANGNITVNASIAGGAWTGGTTYNLIQSGSGSISVSDFTKGTIAGLTSRQNATLVQVNPNTIGLQITGDSPKWTGLDSTSWMVGSTGASHNWKLISGGAATDYIQGDSVLFDDSASSAVTPGSVVISGADVSPAATTFNNSSSGIATYTVSGGFGVASGALNKNNSGTVILNTVNSYTGGTTINGGILSFVNGALSTSGTIDFIGNSSLRWSSGNTQDLSSRIKIEDGITATIDTGANTVPFASALTLGSLQTGALTKAGSGTLTLSASSPYTGVTTINAGTLTLSGIGSINSSSGITINGSGAKYLHTASVPSALAITQTLGTVDGTGTLGTLNVANNSANILQHGNGATTTLTIGTLAFGGAATVNINRSASTTTPEINVTGALSTTPANGQVTINVSAASWTSGTTYNLIGFGSQSFSLSDFTKGTVTGLNSHQSAALVLNGSRIALQITSDSPKWTGLDSTSWLVGSTGANHNWILATGGTPTDYIEGDTVVFDDTSTSAVTPGLVTISATNVIPVSTTFSNSTTGIATYTVSGSFGIAGGSLTKNNNGTLVLNTSNSYAGGTAINGGTVRAGNNNALGGSGSVTFGAASNAKLQVNGKALTIGGLSAADSTATVENANASAGVLNVNTAGTTTYPGILQNGTGGGALALTKSGAGTLTLSAANTYTGGTSINGGVISAGTADSLGSGPVSVNSGGLRLVLANGVTFTNSITIGAGTGTAGRDIIEPAPASTATVTGPITITSAAAGGGQFGTADGSSTLIVQGFVNVSPGVTIAQRAGTVVYAGGGNYTGLQVNQDKVVVGANNGLSTSVLISPFAPSAAATLDLNGFNQTIAGIVKSSFAGTIINSSATSDSTLTVNGTSTYSGTIADSGTGTKLNLVVSGGAFTLTANDNYVGTTTISGGTLALSGSGAIPNSTSITVGGGAMFNVSGLTTLPFALGGSVTLSNSSVGALLNGSFDCSVGTLSLVTDGANPSFSQTNGTLIISASTVINVSNTGATLAAGTYPLIAVASTGNFGTVVGTVPASVVVSGNGASGAASLQINGSGGLDLVVTGGTPPQAVINSVTVNGSNLILQGTNGAASGTYSILTSTNLASPLASWTTNTSGSFTAGGAFSNGVPITTQPQRFFLIKQP